MFCDGRETLVLTAVENGVIESARTLKIMDYSISLLNKAYFNAYEYDLNFRHIFLLWDEIHCISGQ